MATHRRFPHIFVLFFALALAALPLRAQLDPKLQASKTDFLDLYQQTNSATLKPEIATVFDFSGSTQNLMYHGSFPNLDSADSDNPNKGGQLKITVTRSGSGTKAKPYTYAVSGALTGTAYDPRNASSSLGALTLTFAGLVTPAGNLVTSAIVDGMGASGTPGDSSTPRESDPINWMLCASHARFRLKGSYYTYINGKGATVATGGTKTSIAYDRTIDIPLGWSVLGINSNGTVTTNADTAPLTPLQVDDTSHSGSKYYYDTNYSNSTGSLWNGGGVTTTTAKTAYVTTTGYAPNYIGWIFQGTDANGSFIIPAAGTWSASPTLPATTTWAAAGLTVSSAGVAFADGIPGLTRSQAVKYAAIQTWVAYQDKVVWAFRFLDPSETGHSTDVSTDSRTTITSGSPNTTQIYGADRGWTLMNNTTASPTNSSIGIQRMAALFPANSTPLTYAEANAYAQFNDSKSIFNDYEVGTNKPEDCMKHFLIVFTDGQPNTDGSPTNVTPYLDSTSATTGSAAAGNKTIIAGTTNINDGGKYWNIQTLAAMAAHGGDQNLKAGNYINPAATTYPLASAGYSKLPSAILPFWIQGRGPTSGTDAVNGNGKFTTPHAIQTMTVGLSLGGSYTDSTSGKARLFQAAVFGDPSVSSWDISTITPFAFSNPSDTTSGKAANSAYFFDATDPQTLVNGLGAAFSAATAVASNNVAATPTTPPVGLAYGNQIYMGTFEPPTAGGPVWGGDLFMYSTYTSTTSTSTTTTIIDNSGNPVTVPDATTAQWAASIIFATTSKNPHQAAGNKKWSSRTIWTRIPPTSGIPNPGLVRFQPSTKNPDGTTNTTWNGNDAAYAKIAPYVGASSLSEGDRDTLINFVLGADTASTSAGTTFNYPNRSTIMGDIIDSAPGVIEYDLATWGSSLTGTLATAYTAHASDSPAPHFRVLFIGDNQGFLHAFGELSYSVPATISDPNSTSGGTISINVTNAVVDELWGFIPTDFLSNLAYLQDSKNTHRFMVDGSPYAYFLDAPSSNAISGDGKVDFGERALVVFGLRKGGRSYYALDVSNPFTPHIGMNDNGSTSTPPAPLTAWGGWAIQPDYSTTIPGTVATSSAPIATVQSIVGKMGFSSSQPYVGRVLYDGGAASLTVRDAVFLGGGFSTSDIEANYLDSGGKPIRLGRSALAIDINTGQYLMTWDLTGTTFWKSASTTTQPLIIGPVAAGVVPFVINQSSGLASRAYLNDYAGNLWALGETAASSSTGYSGFRVDSTILDHWTTNGSSATTSNSSVRLVYSAQSIKGSAITTPNNNGILSTLPAPFLVGNFPVTTSITSGSSTFSVNPFAVGIAINSGDRNNPLDRNYGAANPQPTQHNLVVVFDRQDSSALGLDSTGIVPSNLYNATSSSTNTTYVTEGNDNFYLSPKTGSPYRGYTINYPTLSSSFTNKAINDPLVLSGTLFFSYFSPVSSDPCTGGIGYTYSSRICDVVQPVFNNFGAAASTQPLCSGGLLFTWSGVATNYSPQSSYTVTQAGMIKNSSGSSGSNATSLSLQTGTGNPNQRLPRPRTWRVVR